MCGILVNIPLRLRVVIGLLQFRVKQQMFPGCQCADEHVVLRTHPYVGLAALLAGQTYLTVRRSQHPRQHLAEMKIRSRNTRIGQGKVME